MRPGEGSEFVYSPVHVNATLHCVIDDLFLLWNVDGLSFISDNVRAMLNSRGIFLKRETSLEGITSSNLTVYGDIQINNNISICCESRNEDDSSCTTFIIYGILTACYRDYYCNNVLLSACMYARTLQKINRSSITT